MITEEFGCLYFILFHFVYFILFKLGTPENYYDLNHKNKDVSVAAIFQQLFSLPKCVILEFIIN